MFCSGDPGHIPLPRGAARKTRLWEKRCAEDPDDDIASPDEEVFETKLIEGDDNEQYPFDMEEGDELVFSIDANDYLDAVVCEEEDIDEWSDGEYDDDRPLRDHFWSRTGIMAGDYTFTAPEEGRYVLLLIKWDDEATEVSVDAAVWTEDA